MSEETLENVLSLLCTNLQSFNWSCYNINEREILTVYPSECNYSDSEELEESIYL